MWVFFQLQYYSLNLLSRLDTIKFITSKWSLICRVQSARRQKAGRTNGQKGPRSRFYTVDAGTEGGLLWHAWKYAEEPSKKSKGYLFIICYNVVLRQGLPQCPKTAWNPLYSGQNMNLWLFCLHVMSSEITTLYPRPRSLKLLPTWCVSYLLLSGTYFTVFCPCCLLFFSSLRIINSQF